MPRLSFSTFDKVRSVISASQRHGAAAMLVISGKRVVTTETGLLPVTVCTSQAQLMDSILIANSG